MKVSIIIPNFNNSSFLNDCLDSAINQGFDVVEEIIIVDDNSTDNSMEILKSYKNLFPNKIFIYKNPKNGVQSARNFGFRKSKGAYIQWLDSDDVLSPNKIKKQLNLLINENYKVISFCDWVYFKNNIQNVIPKTTKKFDSCMNPQSLILDLWTSGSMVQTACWLTHRDLCEDQHWDTRWIKNQDGIYFFDILLRCEKVLFCGETLVYYRKPISQNISSQNSFESLTSLLESYSYFHKILEIKDSIKIRKSLAFNYARFIYYIFPKHNKLRKLAIKKMNNLGVYKFPSIGGLRFRILKTIFGFYLATLMSKSANFIRKDEN